MDIENLSYEHLKTIAKQYKIPYSRLRKAELITAIRQHLYSLEKTKSEKRYKRIKELGSGKEGITYLVKTSRKEYAMKTFRPNKSVQRLQKEAELQKMAKGLSPSVKETNTTLKYIVMDRLDETLVDVINRNKGVLDDATQQQIVDLVDGLDKIGVFHADPNPSNFMLKSDKMYIIDYGFAKKIDDKLQKQHSTKRVNRKFMIIGLLVQLRDMYSKYDKDVTSSYHILRRCVPKTQLKKMGL